MVKSNFSSTLKGVFWMIITGLLFVGVTAIVKYVGTALPAVQAAFLRYTLGVIIFLPLLPKLKGFLFTPLLWKLSLSRAIFHSVGVTLWFYAMASIPIAEVTAMNYLAPVYVTIGAAIFLGEKLALRRIFAVIVALIGMLIILRPGFREVGLGHLAMLVAAVVFGGSYILAKRLSDFVAPTAIVVLLSIFVSIALAPIAISVWVTPTAREIMLLFSVAILATLGHYTMTLAFKSAPVAVTQPVTFLQLLWAVAVGNFIFSEVIDIWVISGGLVIISAVSFISVREAFLTRQLSNRPKAEHSSKYNSIF